MVHSRKRLPAMSDPAYAIIELTHGHVAARCLHIVAELGVADHVDAEPVSPDVLAEKTNASVDAIARMLRRRPPTRSSKPSPSDRAATPICPCDVAHARRGAHSAIVVSVATY
jgi:hypothetical protein